MYLPKTIEKRHEILEAVQSGSNCMGLLTSFKCYRAVCKRRREGACLASRVQEANKSYDFDSTTLQ